MADVRSVPEEATVDVVIATVGRPTLVDAVRSARGQVGVDTRVIVVLDDPSAEQEVRALVSRYAEVLVNRRPMGGGASRQRGVSAGSAPWVAFLDDDDHWTADKLRSQLDVLERDDSQVSWTGTRFVSRRERTLPAISMSESGLDVGSYLVTRPGVRHGYGYIQTSSLLVARPVIERIQWDPTLAKHQDWDLVIRLLSDPVVRGSEVSRALTVVVQGSAGSVSRVRDWRASVPFFERHSARWTGRARADFVMVHLVRSALSAREWRSAVELLRSIRSLPHLGAALVGFSGLIAGLRAGRSKARVKR